ncbi:hypothetical protein M8J76_001300 [Diaphorina citri]|nr:hypothetical protein M8J76_001300 [Diaphorina citri]
MKCILIFDQLNDVMYSKCDPGFVKHLKKYARKEGFNIDREEQKDDHSLSTDELIQIFSPIVTSARVMGWQFSNSYISIQCDDGINLVFDEYMGHILIIIGHGEVQWLQRIIKTCSFFIKNLCGPDITLLKESSQVHDLLSNMIDTWCSLRHSDQNILVEGVEQLSISSDLAATAIKALEMSAQCYKKIADFKNVHSFVLVHNKILSLYSSCRNNIELTAADIITLSIISTSLQATKTSVCPEYSDPESKTTTSEEEFYSLEASPTVKRKHPPDMTASPSQFNKDQTFSSVLLLTPRFLPHAVHISFLAPHIPLFTVLEVDNDYATESLCSSFYFTYCIQVLLHREDKKKVKTTFQTLDDAMKCLFEILKRKRGSVKSAPSHLTKQLSHKWDNIKKCFSEFSKHDSDEHLVRIESNLKPFVDQLRSLTRFLCLDQSVLILLETPGKKSTQLVYHQLKNFIDFLCIKAFKNFDLSSYPLSTTDFPGLVHFIYVDRKTHRVVAPTLDLGSKQCLISADKLWKMVDMGQQYLHDGYLQIIWKDSTFSYSYFCWFENSSGAPLKPSRTPVNAMEYVSIPGILCGDFYQRLISKCFVKKSGGAGGGGLSGVKCYELYCVHLSLATSSCILEHTRRLAATVWEVSGIPSVNTDFV